MAHLRRPRWLAASLALMAIALCGCGRPTSAASSKDCKPNEYWNGAYCLSCPTWEGQYQPRPGSTTCKQCPAGTAPDNAGTGCTTCKAGTAAELGAAFCRACDTSSGYFSSKPGSTNCTQCAAGSVPSKAGTACVKCKAGEYAEVGSGECTSCSTLEGFYSPQPGAAACKPCAAGTAPDSSSTGCVACAPGTFAAVGDGRCSSCATGQVSLKAGSSKCQACPLGFTSSKDGKACLACPSGMDPVLVPLDVGGAAARCSECTGSALDTLPGSCPKGSGRVSCDVDAKCQACPPGTYAAFSVNQVVDSCVPCPRSTYTATPGSTKCTPCPANRAFLGRGGTSVLNCTFRFATRAFKVRESISRRSSGALYGEPFNEVDDSTPRVVKAESGKALAVSPVFPLSRRSTGIVDYVIFALPDGRWLVHLTTTGGGVTTCAALPGPFRIKCVFEDETIVVDRFNFSQTKATLTLEFVP